MKGFRNAKVYIKGKGIFAADVSVAGDKIDKIANAGELAFIDEPFPYGDGQIVVPGFIDEHIHGAGGADAMDGTPDALDTVSAELVKEGTTSFLATTMTQSEENIISALSAVNACVKNGTDGATVLGAHLEGPFISEKHIGAQPLKHLKDPDVKLYEKFLNACENNIRLITLAPEEPAADELIKAAAKHGATVSAGHTDAGELFMRAGIKAGISCVTHTYNAMRPVHHREIGTVGAAMLFDELYTEIICDLIHVSPSAIKLLLKTKPKDKIILITDAMRAKGLPDGVSELGGQKVFVKDGQARLSDNTLAGSVLKMNVAIKNMVETCGAEFTDAIDFATCNPARNLRLKGRGEIKEGYFADFTVLDKNYNVCATVVGGKTVYKADDLR